MFQLNSLKTKPEIGFSRPLFRKVFVNGRENAVTRNYYLISANGHDPVMFNQDFQTSTGKKEIA
jgi:hypothetical protein